MTQAESILTGGMFLFVGSTLAAAFWFFLFFAARRAKRQGGEPDGIIGWMVQYQKKSPFYDDDDHTDTDSVLTQLATNALLGGFVFVWAMIVVAAATLWLLSVVPG